MLVKTTFKLPIFVARHSIVSINIFEKKTLFKEGHKTVNNVNSENIIKYY